MNEQQLRDAIKEAVALLLGIDQAIPGKVDGELVKFLEDAQASDWTLTLLHTSLARIKETRQTTRRTA